MQQWPAPGPNWSTLRICKEVAFQLPYQGRSVASDRTRLTDWHILRAMNHKIWANYGDALYILYDIALWGRAVSNVVFQPIGNWNLLDFTLGSVTVYYREISLIRPNQIGIPTLVSGKTSTWNFAMPPAPTRQWPGSAGSAGSAGSGLGVRSRGQRIGSFG